MRQLRRRASGSSTPGGKATETYLFNLPFDREEVGARGLLPPCSHPPLEPIVKKTNQKLVVSTQTLRHLTQAQLQGAKGGQVGSAQASHGALCGVSNPPK